MSSSAIRFKQAQENWAVAAWAAGGVVWAVVAAVWVAAGGVDFSHLVLDVLTCVSEGQDIAAAMTMPAHVLDTGGQYA
jgi:hypothetical protein